MNSVDRGRAFLQSLWQDAKRTAWDWQRCPACGDTLTCKWGSYRRHPWFFDGRQVVRVQRHRCERCRRTYSETSPLLVRGSWYAREGHRLAVDQWQHVRSSLRRTAEWVRSWLGRQERWHLWRPLDRAPAAAERWHLSASTVHRWLDRAGQVAEATRPEQLAGVPTAGQLGTDGLWVRLRGKTKRVVAEHLAEALVHLLAYNRGLLRVAPEWCWRDFRWRLSRGRNHGSTVRRERAALVWAIYRNFEPAQWRSERKRRYRSAYGVRRADRPGQSPLAVAGVPPGAISSLDALSV